MSSHAIGGEVLVNTHKFGFRPGDSSVTTLADGSWVVTWTTYGAGAGTSADVIQQHFDASGNRLGENTRVNTFIKSDQDASSVIALSDGGWLVTWTAETLHSHIYTEVILQQRFDADGKRIGEQTQVNTSATGEDPNSTVAKLADGGWVVAWDSFSQDDHRYNLFQQRYDSDGNEVGGETKVSSAHKAMDISSTIALADGGWLVTWDADGKDGNHSGVFQQRYDADGDKSGETVQVNTSTTGDQDDAAATALADGGWVVTWTSGKSIHFGHDDVYQQRYDADGNTVGKESRVNTSTSGDQHNSTVTSFADGGWVVVWDTGGQKSGGDDQGVYQQCYDADGEKAGGETRVNIHVSGHQDYPAVTAFADGSWLVTWDSAGGPYHGGRDEVLQRHFAPDVIGDGAANDLSGTQWDENLVGKAGDDRLSGLAGADLLDGGAGMDELTGGDGQDRLIGGTKADIFIYGAVTDSTVEARGRDTISDFSETDGDSIDLRSIDANDHGPGDQKFDFIKTDDFHHQAGELRYDITEKGAIVYGDVDGNGEADFAITLIGVTGLQNTDFAL